MNIISINIMDTTLLSISFCLFRRSVSTKLSRQSCGSVSTTTISKVIGMRISQAHCCHITQAFTTQPVSPPARRFSDTNPCYRATLWREVLLQRMSMITKIQKLSEKSWRSEIRCDQLSIRGQYPGDGLPLYFYIFPYFSR